MASLNNGKKIENSSHGVWSEPVERGGKINWRDKVESRFGLGYLTPAAFVGPASHGTFAQ